MSLYPGNIAETTPFGQGVGQVRRLFSPQGLFRSRASEVCETGWLSEKAFS